jgi:hypothetical protein
VADNTLLNPGTAGDTIRTVQKGASKTEVVILDMGGSGAESLVSASNPLPVTGGLTDAQLRAAPAPAVLQDSLGNPLDVVTGLSGDLYLGTSMIQDLHEIPENSSTANLAAGATFTGTVISTSGVAGIWVMLKATVAVGACTCTVFIDQSGDGTNWDVTDQYTYVSTKSFGVTVMAVGAHFRVRVTNNSSTITNVFRLFSALCPVANPLPRSLSQRGNLNTAVNRLQDQFDFYGHFTPSSALQVVEPYRLVGTTFGAAIDTNFWTALTSGAGSSSTVATGVATVGSGTANGGYGKMTTVRVARFVIDNPHKWRGIMRLPTVAVASSLRGWGPVILSAAVAPQNGAYFSVDAAGVLSVNTVSGGTITSVASGNFNGDSAQYILNTSQHIYDIIYSIAGVWFIVDGVLLHTVTSTTAQNSLVMDLPINFWATNTAIAAGATLECWGSAISRLGRDLSAPALGRISGAAATYLFKTGSGVLQRFIFNNVSGTTVTIYDNTTAVAPILAVITTSAAAHGVWDMQMPFYTGLTMVTVGANLDATVVYE